MILWTITQIQDMNRDTNLRSTMTTAIHAANILRLTMQGKDLVAHAGYTRVQSFNPKVAPKSS